MAENQMGKKVSFHLTNKNEGYLKAIQDYYLEETGVVTQAFVLNKALSYFYDKEFKKNQGEKFINQKITEYTIIEKDKRFIIKLGKHLYYSEHTSHHIVTTKDFPSTYFMNLSYAEEIVVELKNDYDDNGRFKFETEYIKHFTHEEIMGNEDKIGEKS